MARVLYSSRPKHGFYLWTIVSDASAVYDAEGGLLDGTVTGFELEANPGPPRSLLVTVRAANGALLGTTTVTAGADGVKRGTYNLPGNRRFAYGAPWPVSIALDPV